MDSTAAVKALIHSAYLNNTGVAYLPPGIHDVSEKIVVPEGVAFRGAGRFSTILRAMPDEFPVNTPVVQLGDDDASTQVQWCRVEDMEIQAEEVPESIGVYSSKINEHSGAFRCRVRANQSAVWIDRTTTGSPKNFSIEHVTGVLYSDGGITFNIGTQVGCALFRCTANGAAGKHAAIGFGLDGPCISLKDSHVENAVDGCLVGVNYPANCCFVSNFNASTVEGDVVTLVRLAAGRSTNFTGIALCRNAATNCIVNEDEDQVLTDAYVGLYPYGGGKKTENRALLSTAAGAGKITRVHGDLEITGNLKVGN